MYEVPSIFHSQGKAVDKDREEAEILAKSFFISAGDFFERKVAEEIRLARLIAEKKKFMNYILGVALIGILAIVLYLFLSISICIITGIIFIIIALGIYVVKYKRILRDIKNSEILLKNMAPERKLSFVSKVHVPLYLVPYAKGAMLFDPNMRGHDVKVDLVNLDANQIEMGMGEFSKSVSRYQDNILPRNSLRIEEVLDFNKDIVHEKILEKEIIDSMSPLVKVTSNDEWIRESFRFSIHTPETVISNSLANVIGHSVETKPDTLISTSTSYPSPHMIESVEKLRGVELASRSSSIMDLVKVWYDKIEMLPVPIEGILTNNISKVQENNDGVKVKAGFQLNRQVCSVCFNEALVKRDIRTEYDLQQFIVEQFRSSIDVMDTANKCLRCGWDVEVPQDATGEFTCTNCGHKANALFFQPPQNRANEMIRERINVNLNDLPMEGMFGLPQLQKVGEKWQCPKHKSAELMKLKMLSDVISHTGNELWEEMKKPIKDSVKEANRFSTQNRQKWKDQNLALTPIRQIYTDLEVELNEVETKLAQAEKILEVLRGY